MKRRYLLFVNLIFCFCILYPGCSSLPEDVLQSLEDAGNNRLELERVLNHYKGTDRKKYKAACFLIANMRYHQSDETIIPPEEYQSFFERIDSLYEKLFSGMSISDIISYKSRVYDELRRKLSSDFVRLPDVFHEGTYVSDVTSIKADYLIDNIDFAFELWNNGKYKNTLDFETFLECVLPYRTTTEYITHKRSELYRLFEHRILCDTCSNIIDYIEQYKAYVEKCRWLNYFTKPTSHFGIYDLFLDHFKNDCHNISSWTSNIFRSFGIPIVYEYTPQWQDLTKRHFWCSTPDSVGIFSPFTPPDNNIKEDWDSYIKYAGKVYRKSFKANKNSPYFLRHEYEMIPKELASPLLSDQTFRYHQTVTLRLPFDIDTENNLAYLCFFGGANNVLNAVAWGKIDHDKKTAVFEQVPLNILFFPAYYSDDEEIVSFGNPFILKSDGIIAYIPKPITSNTLNKKNVCDLSIKDNALHYTGKPKSKPQGISYIPIKCNDEKTIDVNVTRKYPEKRSLKDIYPRLVGSFILGGNSEKGDFDTLYVLNQPPKPYFQEIILDNKKKYRYYKFATGDKGHSNIAHIEFLGPKTKAADCTKPTPLPVFSEHDTIAKNNELYKISGMPLKTGSNPHHAFDGNMETYVGSSHLGMDFGNPILITHVRFAPRNANNMITVGDKYELMYFDKVWKSHEVIEAKNTYIKFEGLPAGTVFWLRNLTIGNEELPFFHYNGKQHFINVDTGDLHLEAIN